MDSSLSSGSSRAKPLVVLKAISNGVIIHARLQCADRGWWAFRLRDGVSVAYHGPWLYFSVLKNEIKIKPDQFEGTPTLTDRGVERLVLLELSNAESLE